MEENILKNGDGQRVDMSMDKIGFVHGQGVDMSMDTAEIVYGQSKYLSMDKAAEYTSFSEKTLRRKVREVLISQGLDWKSSSEEIWNKVRKIKKVNVKKNILGFSSFDWELSAKWLDEIKKNIVHRQGVDSGDGQSMVKAEFMTNNPASNQPPAPDINFMEIGGRKYSKEHLEDILESYKEERETKKTMMELQKQINVVMAQMGQIQKMMLLKDPNKNEENNNY